jgi:hypothetical protein
MPILGILMLVSYLLDTAALRPPGSIIHLFSTLSCISFVAEFFRSRALAFLGLSEVERRAAVSPFLTCEPRKSTELRHGPIWNVESVVGPLVVQQFHRRNELDRPFTNRIGRNCLALGGAGY